MSTQQFVTNEEDLHFWVESIGKRGNETCLFISGAGANSTFWPERLCESLVSNGFFVIRYDHRDTGYSSKIDWEKAPYDFMQLVKDAVFILDSYGIRKAHVVGHSMGGFIAQLLAIHYPDRVISMISISSSTHTPDIPAPPEKTWQIYLSNQPQNDIKKDLKGFLKVWKYLNGTAEFDEAMAIEYTKKLYDRQDINGAVGESHVKAQASLTDRTEALKQVKIPTLVIHGEDDYAVDKYGGIRTAESIENATLVLIPQMGHIPFNREILNKFENEIIRFIKRNKQNVDNTHSVTGGRS